MNGPVPADKLSYELYQDSNGTVWNTTQIVTYAAPSRGEKIFAVHGRIFAGQDMTAGNYADTVVASINF
jgi:spore coat protein U-like protein